MEEIIPTQLQRFYRKTVASPEDWIRHDGDCYIWSNKVCTCGLLHTLLPMSEQQEKYYPKYWEEWNAQQRVFDKVRFGEE